LLLRGNDFKSRLVEVDDDADRTPLAQHDKRLSP
jgi:hypothetical protein